MILRPPERLSVYDVPSTPAQVSEQTARQAVAALRRFRLLEERSVLTGRAAGVSWDRLGEWLRCPGETLRRRYGGKVAG